MAEEIVYQDHAYRCVGGEIHRRPLKTEGLKRWEASWLVLDHGEEIPQDLRAQLMVSSAQLRFD